jgi:glutathione synthase/RimK-type ligase-like ATP-grasp enzyme
MTFATTAGTRTHVTDPVALIGVAALAKMAFDCVDLSPLQQSLTDRFLHDAGDTAALMDLSAIKQLYGARADGLQLQAQALQQNRLYRRRPATAKSDAIRLLAFVAPGDFMANAPLEFLLDGSNITLDLLYVVPGALPPAVIPEHDLAIVAVGESDDNRAVLREVASLIRDWKRPVLNVPSRIAELSRDAACSLLHAANGTAIPTTLRVAREILERIGAGATAVASILVGGKFPIIARPIGSHAGDGLSKLDDAAAVVDYLHGRPEEEFYISPFVDYRSADGLFRKYRIALIDGQPYACHMAVSQHWMVHYLNAGMTESAAKRDEEARFMATFDDDFAMRHKVALQAIAERVGLAYFAIDCGELPDGSLLLFEADVAMIVHAMDPPDMFPYKGPQMRKVFAAFAAMLRKYAQPAAA